MADKGFQMKNLRLLVWFVLFWLSSLSYAKELLREQQEGVAVVLEQLVEGLGIPWGMAFVDAHQLLVSERRGTPGVCLRPGWFARCGRAS